MGKAIDKAQAQVQKSQNTTNYVSTMSSAHKRCPVMLSQTGTYQQVRHSAPAFYELTHHVHGVRLVYRLASSTVLPRIGTRRPIKVQARSSPKARTPGAMLSSATKRRPALS